jgi:drug/metabolite transporter (DMT)-like permease
MPLIRHRRARRVIAATLIVAGAIVMWLSPSVQPGLLAFAFGVGLELVGLVLERRRMR